jgi:MFS family permease
MSTAPSNAPTPRKKMSPFQQAILSFYWFATNAHWTAIMMVLMPSQVKSAVGGDVKGSMLGLALGAGAFMSMIIAPAFGALSDRIRLPGGRRKPWMILGTAGNIIGLFGLAYFIQPGNPASLGTWTIAFLWVELFNNIATAPYSALIPDMVTAEQRGSASGWMGLMTVLGMFFGGLTGFFISGMGITGVYYLLMGIMALGLVVTLVGVHEPLNVIVRPFKWNEFWRGLYDPFKHANFTWVFLTRLLVTMGVYTVQEFLQYYMGDVVGAPFTLAGLGEIAKTPEEAVSFFILPLLLGAILCSLVAGVLSDRYGRKLMVYVSGFLQGIVALVLVFTHNFTLVVFMGVIFGLGYGAYEAVDWALASDVLPSMDDYAKDMGVWHVATVLPQVIATPFAGFLLDNFQQVGRINNIPNLGYTVIFSIAVVFFALGTFFVKQIKGVR